MFQTVALQNLVICGDREGHHFEFQRSGDWKSMKLQNGVEVHLSVSDAA
jgi:hypothetical protein